MHKRTLQWFRERLGQAWTFMRCFRLALGCYLAYESIVSHELMLAFFSVFFLYQAISASSCCGLTQAAPVDNRWTEGDDVIEYEEVGAKPISKK